VLSAQKIKNEVRTPAGSSDSSQRITLPITGMTCAACQSFLQRTLASETGVKEAAVNLMLHNATITFDPHLTSPAALIETVRGVGYDAAMPLVDESVLDEQIRHDEQQLVEYKRLRLKTTISLAAGAVAMVLSMPLMSMSHTQAAEHVKDPLMAWNMRVLDPVLRDVLP